MSYTYLVKTGQLTLSCLADKMSFNPSEILNLGAGEIKEGALADLTIADLSEKYVIDSGKFLSKGKNTPFNGFEVYGKVLYTIVDGNIKYKN